MWIKFVVLTRFNGSRAILSGPAGGVVGYALTSYQKDTDLPVIGIVSMFLTKNIFLYYYDFFFNFVTRLTLHNIGIGYDNKL